MIRNYKEAKCNECGQVKQIVYTRGSLCFSCNKHRLTKRYSERQKNKPLVSKKTQKSISDDKQFYMEIWEERPHFCAECEQPLANVTAEEAAKYYKYYFSHIIKKGTYPNKELRRDKRNMDLLCLKDHDRWEHAHTRKDMKIYAKNKIVIVELLKEYGYTK